MQKTSGSHQKPPIDSHDVMARFFARTAAGISPGLQAVTHLLEKLGNPQHEITTVHVAGTNGKGSTSAMIERVLREAGFNTGLSTSPHLVRFNERIRMNGDMISDEVLAELAAELEVLDDGGGGRLCTFFELATALAYTAFARAREGNGVDVAVIEVGLGGTYDATNVITPAVSVITPISRDHTRYLGDDILGIAREKCGIIKPGRAVVTSRQQPAVAQLIEDVTADQEAGPVHIAPDWVKAMDVGGQLVLMFQDGFCTDPFHFPLRGNYQRENILTAAMAARLVLEDLGVELDSAGWARALSSVQWPGRFQHLNPSETAEGQPPMFLDGAHNPAGARALLETLETEADQRPIAWIVGFLRDKEITEILEIWHDRMSAGRVWSVPISQARGMKEDELQETLPQSIVADLETAMNKANEWAAENNGVVMIAGSLYLVGAVLERC